MSSLSTRYRKMRASRFLYRIIGFNDRPNGMDYERMAHHWYQAMDHGGSYATVSDLDNTVGVHVRDMR